LEAARLNAVRAGILLAVACAAALSGCLQQREDEGLSAPACDLLGGPDDVPADARGTAGTGPRTVTIANVPPRDAIAVWWQEADHVVVLHLRSHEGVDGGPISVMPSVAKAPAGVAVRIVAGDDAWTLEGFVAAGTQDVLVDLERPEIVGSLSGTWDEPVSMGFASGPAATSWQPNDLPWADQERIQRLDEVVLTLAWENGAAGGADFGIAIAPTGSDEFSWRNAPDAASQASAGPQGEERVVTAAELAALGWSNVTGLRAGPSVSTGAFATTGIAYDLGWRARFAPDPDLPHVCATLGDVDAVIARSG
jgi:hypothetical protein